MKSVKLNLKEGENLKDYTFRYKLNLESEKTPVFHHHLAELVRGVLENLLNLIVPLKAGRDVKIDGFRWLTDKEQTYPLSTRTDPSFPYYDFSKTKQSPDHKNSEQNVTFQSTANATFYEPRIDLIKKLTESLLSLVEFEHKGKPVKIESFRLKNLQDWLVTSAGDPNEIINYATSRCDCDCVFCCNKGNPPIVAACDSLNRTAKEEFDEIKTRIKYFSPEAERALFPSLGCIYETVPHPYFIDTLRLLRDKTSKPFRVTTNGCNFTRSTVAELAKMKPVYLYFSLNSSSPSRRMKLMRDPNPEIAINALPLLKQYGIPYATVIVPWPSHTIDEMLDDLSSTIAYAAEHEAHLVQVNLPGYSKHFSSTELFDSNRVWKAVISKIRKLREKYDLPILAMPTLYEENIYYRRKNMPQIIGLVKNSPAHLSSLKRGDVIKQINGIPVRDRPQTRDLISLARQNGAREVKLNVQRDEQTLEVILNLARHSYPYSEVIDAYLGIVFMGTGLRMSYIESMKEIMQTHGAKHVLFLSSELVKPTFEQCLTDSHIFGDIQLKIDVEVPKNNFFGGNIFMGDLLVVQDFIDHIKNYVMRKGCKPDLVIIPSSPFNLSGWGRDLTGRVYFDIEREAGIPVELLPCATIYD